ncbi:MAG: hypothetical protein CMF69_04625 [Magnetovibrio sp.]|nr:hypothetical protein [Magnetovibrio sp.]
MEKPEVIRSLYDDQFKILDSILKLHIKEKTFDVDLTYGNGAFYKNGIPQPQHRFDIDDSLKNITKVCNSNNTNLPSASVNSVIFDPPFLTYIKKQRTGNSKMVMSRRFSGYWTSEELSEHYKSSIKEAARILKHKGIMVIKCQDIVHNHKLFCTHAHILNWCSDFFRLKDLFVQAAKHRMPAPNRKGIQKHARIFHSYWIILQRWAK